jgi:hypothetical protein
MDPNGRCESFKSREGYAFHANAHNKGDSPHEEIATRLAAVGPFAMALLPAPGQRLDQSTQQAIQRFLLHNRILDTARWTWITRLTSLRQSQVEYWAPMERVHARGVLDASQPDYGIFRRGGHTDPDTRSVGHQCRRHRYARFVIRRPHDPGRATGDPEVRPGDRLLRSPAPVEPMNLQTPDSAPFIQGHIIDIPKGVTQIGVLDAVTLNKGRRDGLVEGQRLTVISRRQRSGRSLAAWSNFPMSPPAPCWCSAPMKTQLCPAPQCPRPLAVMDRFETADQAQ